MGQQFGLGEEEHRLCVSVVICKAQRLILIFECHHTHGSNKSFHLKTLNFTVVMRVNAATKNGYERERDAQRGHVVVFVTRLSLAGSVSKVRVDGRKLRPAQCKTAIAGLVHDAVAGAC